MPAQDTSFARLTSLAAHDLRTPLATVYGFARTMQRTGESNARYLEMIVEAAGQMTELLEELALAARIEGGRYRPVLVEADTLELAQAAVAGTDGEGALIETDRESVERALAALADCAVQHGGVEAVTLDVRGTELVLSPVTAAAAPVIMGEQLKDLGAAVAVRLVRALGGSVELAGDELRVRLA